MDYVPIYDISSHKVNDEVWVQLGVNHHSLVKGRIMRISGAFALMCFNDQPFDGLFAAVHDLQLRDENEEERPLLSENCIVNCISAAYAFQRSSDAFPDIEDGFMSFVYGMSGATLSQKRKREDELYEALTKPYSPPMAHVGGRIARLPGHRQHPCTCGCKNIVSGAHICEVCKYGVFAPWCFAKANKDNYDGICKPCFNAGV